MMIKIPNKKIQITILASIIGLITLLIVAPLAINAKALKFQIEQAASQNLGGQVEIKGAVKVSFLPLPQIFLSDISILKLPIDDQYSGDISIKRLAIRPSIFSLFGKNIVINKLAFDQPSIDIKYDSKDSPKDGVADSRIEVKTDIDKEPTTKYAKNIGGGNMMNGFFNFEKSGKETFNFQNIKSIQFKNGSFARHNADNELSLSFSKIDFLLKNNLKKQVFNAEGGFMSGDEPTSFLLSVNAKNKNESSLIIQSEIFNLSLKGKFSNSKIEDLIKSNFAGKVEANIIDLKGFVSKYVSKDNLLYRKINSSLPIKINADIGNEAGEISIENIIFKSKLLDGKGKINANFSNPRAIIAADFDFDNIDIDNIWFVGALNSKARVVSAENEIIKQFLGNTNSNINQAVIPNDENKTYLIEKPLPPINETTKPLFNNLDLSATIKIKAAKYYKGDLKNISLNLITKDNNLLLEPLSAELPGEGLLKINGTFENDNGVPKFVGAVQIAGKNLQKSLAWLDIEPKNLKPSSLTEYSFSADLLILPSFNVLNNLNLATIGTPASNLALNLAPINLSGNLTIDDSAGVPSLTANLRMNYLNYNDYFLASDNPYLSRGLLLNKLIWLNSAESNRDIYFSFDQLIYQDNFFDKASFQIKSKQGYFKLANLNFSSPTLDFKGSIEADIGGEIPTLNIDISSNNLTYKTSSQAKSLSDQFFNLPALDDFDGKIALDIKNLKLDNWEASDIKIAGELDGGILNFDNFALKTYKGEAIYKGSMVFKADKTVNGTIELVGTDGGDILSSLMNIENIAGISNLSATINSVAANKAEFFKNLNSSGQFIGSNVLIKGFGIYNLAAKMAQIKKYQQDLSDPQKILYEPETVSIFKSVSGAFVIKKNDDDDQFSIKASSVGINGVISGKIDVENKILDGNANFIFLSGSREKPVPINMAVNFKGKVGAIEKSTNLIQVEQFIEQKLAPIQTKTQSSDSTTNSILSPNSPAQTKN